MMKAEPARKASFPFRLYGMFLLVAAALFLAWLFWRPQIRVARPTLDLSADKVVASTALTNATSTARSVTIHFDLGYQTAGTDHSSGEFRLIKSREIATQVGPGTTVPVSCEFARPTGSLPLSADAQIVSVR